MSATKQKFLRFRTPGGPVHGELEGEIVFPIRGDLFGDWERTGESLPLSEVDLLYPVEPEKILCVGLNYMSHLRDRPKPSVPQLFYKPKTALQHPGGAIKLPKDSKDVHFEAELVIVMGKTADDVSVEHAADYIFGYTCGNDVSERNWQHGSQGDKADKQWWRAKGSNTFGPLGPVIATGLDIPSCRIEGRLNGEVKQEQMLSDLIFPPAEIVSFVSRYVRLEPGDVIYTGTPGNTIAMKPGDEYEVEIEGIGILRNPVVG